MQKRHESPEFTVIKQNEANAKFFVASGNSDPSFKMSSVGPGLVATAFEEGDGIGEDSAW